MRRIVLQFIIFASALVTTPTLRAVYAQSGPVPEVSQTPVTQNGTAPAVAVPASSTSAREQLRIVTRAPRANEAAQPLQQSGDRSTLSQITAMALPLLAVLALIAACAWIFRKLQASSRGGFGGGTGSINSPSGIVSVLGRYSLSAVGSPRQNVLLLQVDRRVLLIGQTLPARGQPGSLATLCELAEPEDVASVLIKVSEAEQSGPAGRFSSMLHNAGSPGEGDSGRLGGLSRLLARLNARTDAPVSWTEQVPASMESPEPTPLATRAQSSVRARLSSITKQPARSQRGVA